MRIILKHTSGLSLLAYILFAVHAACAMAQGGAIRGTISDQSGAIIVGAKLLAHTQPTGAAAVNSVSDAGGAYLLTGLKAGNYALEVAAPGFKTMVVPSVTVADGQTVQVNVRLVVASVSSEVVVTDTSAPEGSYKVEVVNLGPLGNNELLDTPYTVTVVPTNLMENEGVRKFSDVLKYLPGAQMEPRGGMDMGRPQTRGFEGDVQGNSRMDGMNITSTTPYPMEQFDRIEVQSGAAGAQYGVASPAGVFNFVLKRPTEHTTAKLALDLDSPTTTTINGDVGGMVTKYFGYRVDALHTNGTGWVDESHHRREMISASVDVHLAKRTMFQFNGSQFNTYDYGFAPTFAYTTFLVKPLDPTLPGYGQSWAGNFQNTRTVSGRFLHTYRDNWSVTLGGLHQTAWRPGLTVNDTLVSASTFSQSASYSYGAFITDSDIGYIKGRVKTGAFTHDLVIGTTGYVVRMAAFASTPAVYDTNTGKAYSNTSDSLFAPTLVDKSRIYLASALGAPYKSGTTSDEAFVFGDTVSFARRWIAQFVGSEVWIDTRSFTSAAVLSSDFAQTGFAPSASLTYKPADNMSVYFNFASALTAGSIVSGNAANGLPYTNNGASLPAYRSKQYELGYKWSFRQAQLALSAYHMTRPFAFGVSTDGGATYTYEVGGLQQNEGVDFMANGKVTNRVNLFGGFTWLAPTLQNTGVAATTNKQVVGAPRIQSNFLVEYEVPKAHGLFFNGDWHHTGDKAANMVNTFVVPKYDTFDLGARFDQKLKWGDVAWRLSVTNVGNAKYWYGVFPSSINGSGTASTGGSACLGSPRVISASVQYRFDKQR